MAPAVLNQITGNGAGSTKNDAEPRLTSADVVHREHEYGAHNYHPLPVVFDVGKGAK